MDKLIKQLNNLPKAKLRRKKDLKLRFNLYKLIWQESKERIVFFLAPPRQFKPVLTVAVILLIFMISIPGYAYASHNVTRGHVLYNIKKSIEEFELDLAKSEEARVKKYIKMANRRLAEAGVLSSRDEENGNLVNTINEAMDNSFQADLGLENIFRDKDVEKIKKLIEKTKVEQEIILTGIAQTVGINVKEEVLNSVALALETTKLSIEEELNRGQARKFINNLPEAEFSTATEEEASEEATGTEEIPEVTKPQRPIEISLDKRQPKIFMHEAAQQSLQVLKDRVDELKEELPAAEYEAEDITVLFERLDKRIEKAQEFIEEDKLSGFKGLLQSTTAISNNAKHFIKSQKNNNNNKFYNNKDAVNEEDSNENGSKLKWKNKNK